MAAKPERENPGFYALTFVLVIMSGGPVLLMLVNSFKLDVDIISGSTGLLFLPTIQNYETALCDVPYHVDGAYGAVCGVVGVGLWIVEQRILHR